MTPIDILASITTCDTHFDRRRIVVNGASVGLLIPSMAISAPSETGEILVRGADNISLCNLNHAESVWRALIDTKAILFGDSKDVDFVEDLLASSETSRTASYFCCLANSCGEVKQAVLNLRSARVSILGVGGIGSSIAMLLAGAGVIHIDLFDHDVVEQSNLNRQLFYRRSDIGHSKVKVLTQCISERFPNAVVAGHEIIVGTSSLSDIINRSSMAIVTADEPPTLSSEVLSIAKHFGTDVVGCGYNQDISKIYCSFGRSTLPRSSPLKWHRFTDAVMPSGGPPNMELASLAASISLFKICDFAGSQIQTFTALCQTRSVPHEWVVVEGAT